MAVYRGVHDGPVRSSMDHSVSLWMDGDYQCSSPALVDDCLSLGVTELVDSPLEISGNLSMVEIGGEFKTMWLIGWWYM